MFLTDSAAVGHVRRTADGYLVGDAKVARTGVQEYAGAELGRPDMPIVRVYRPPEEVFSQDAMHSYAYRPVTVEHPSKMVDASTWKAVSAGQTGGEVVRDGESVRVPLVLMDAAAIKAWESGKRELSMGYTAEIVFSDGVTPDGQPYDAVQTQMRMNHLALVDRGRAGSEYRIGDRRGLDSQETRANNPSHKEANMSNVTRTVLVDGLSVETTDAGAQAIAKLQQQIADSASALSDAKAAYVKEIEAKDAELGARDAKIAELEKAILSDAELDARVAARAELIATAKRLHDADYTGKSDAEIRAAVVRAKVGDAAVDGKSDAYVMGHFDSLASAGKKDPVRLAAVDGKTVVTDNGYAAFVASLDYRTKKEG